MEIVTVSVQMEDDVKLVINPETASKFVTIEYKSIFCCGRLSKY